MFDCNISSYRQACWSWPNTTDLPAVGPAPPFHRLPSREIIQGGWLCPNNGLMPRLGCVVWKRSDLRKPSKAGDKLTKIRRRTSHHLYSQATGMCTALWILPSCSAGPYCTTSEYICQTNATYDSETLQHAPDPYSPVSSLSRGAGPSQRRVTAEISRRTGSCMGLLSSSCHRTTQDSYL